MILYIMLFLFFISAVFIIYLSYKNRIFQEIIKQKRELIEVIYILASIFTIFSIFYGVWQFNYEQEKQLKIQEENDRIVLENLKAEIHKNLEYISYLEENKNGYLESNNTFPNIRLKYYYLEKTRDLKIDLRLREEIVGILSLIEQSNNLLERYSILYPTNNPEQQETLIQLKNKDFETLITINKEIKKHLQFIEDNLKF